MLLALTLNNSVFTLALAYAFDLYADSLYSHVWEKFYSGEALIGAGRAWIESGTRLAATPGLEEAGAIMDAQGVQMTANGGRRVEEAAVDSVYASELRPAAQILRDSVN